MPDKRILKEKPSTEKHLIILDLRLMKSGIRDLIKLLLTKKVSTNLLLLRDPTMPKKKIFTANASMRRQEMSGYLNLSIKLFSKVLNRIWRMETGNGLTTKLQMKF